MLKPCFLKLALPTAVALAAIAMSSVAKADDDEWRGRGWGEHHDRGEHRGWDHEEGWHHGWDQPRYPAYGAYQPYGYGQTCYVTRQRTYDAWGYPHWQRVRVCE